MYRLWEPGELDEVLAHPEMTAAELASRLPGRTAKAVRRIRERHGRGSGPAVCRLCDRPVWAESARARRMGLCKGCYLDEMERREAEERRAGALRKRMHDARAREARANQGKGQA